MIRERLRHRAAKGPDGEKRPADVIGAAVKVMRIATGGIQEQLTEKNSGAVEHGRLGGRKGGVARKQALSAERRKQIARRAAEARWKSTEPPSDWAPVLPYRPQSWSRRSHAPSCVVSKLATSPYRPRRTVEWLKIKCLHRREFVIGGWQESDKRGRSLKSLLLGYYDRAGALVFAGKGGTGFSLQLCHELVDRLRKIEPIHRSPRSRAIIAAARVGPSPGLWRRWPTQTGPATTSCGIPASKGSVRTRRPAT